MDLLLRRLPVQKAVFFVSRLLLSVVFLSSGILKLVSPASAAELMTRLFSVTPQTGYWMTVLLSSIEIIIALALFWKPGVVPAALTSSLFLLGSTVVGLLLISDPIPCGCFGSAIESKTDVIFLVRNFAFLTASIFVLRRASENRY